jgi:hypothetical protein
LILSFLGGPYDGARIVCAHSSAPVDLPKTLWVERRTKIFDGRTFLVCEMSDLHTHEVQGYAYKAAHRAQSENGARGAYLYLGRCG